MRIRLRPATLRHKAREQGALRGRGPTTQVNIDKLILDRHYAARLCGVTSATLRQRILAGKIPNISDALEVRLGDVYRP